MGHVKREYRILKREKGEGNKNETETNTIVTECDVIIVCDDNSVSLVCQESEWVIDCSTSFHVTPHGDSFTSYSTGDFGNVKIGNSGASKIVGIGNISWRLILEAS